jgi:hypothetical protein
MSLPFPKARSMLMVSRIWMSRVVGDALEVSFVHKEESMNVLVGCQGGFRHCWSMNVLRMNVRVCRWSMHG